MSHPRKLSAAELDRYRSSDDEQNRVRDIVSLVPQDLARALDIGARDGFISKALADLVKSVTALDLTRPNIVHERIECVSGDATSLRFADSAFDLVLCSEVLEHIPNPKLEIACKELARVSKKYVLIGVPFRQDLRASKTTCQNCAKTNPPWGHVNSFDVNRLQQLFVPMRIARRSFVGLNNEGTNWLSSLLMDFAGNPFGTYDQEEACIACGQEIGNPRPRTLPGRIATRIATSVDSVQRVVAQAKPKWVHVLFEKSDC